jgi:hypothetical protein
LDNDNGIAQSYEASEASRRPAQSGAGENGAQSTGDHLGLAGLEHPNADDQLLPVRCGVVAHVTNGADHSSADHFNKGTHELGFEILRAMSRAGRRCLKDR